MLIVFGRPEDIGLPEAYSCGKETVRLLRAWVSFGENITRKRIFCNQLYRSIFNHCNVGLIGFLIYQIRQSRSNKVTEVGVD